jgi:hypothetical protein
MSIEICRPEMKNSRVKINKADWMDNKAISGTIHFTINGRNYKAYSWCNNFKENCEYNVEFFFLDSGTEWHEMFNANSTKRKTLIPVGENWDYECFGQVLSVNPVIADFGDLTLDIGHLSHDTKLVGEYIWLKIDRLSIDIVE